MAATASDFRTDEMDAEIQMLLGKLEKDKDELLEWLRERIAEQVTPWEVRDRWLADLATWPRPFWQACQPWVIDATRDAGEAIQFDKTMRESREPRVEDLRRSTCSCGCVGAHGRLAWHLRSLRADITHYRAGKTPRARTHRRKRLEWAKETVLQMLWQVGRHRIDRRAFEEHAVHVTQELMASWSGVEFQLGRAMEEAQRYRAWLADGHFSRGKHKGEPFDDDTREHYEGRAEDAEASVAALEERAMRQRRLCADPAECARAYTDCSRTEWRVRYGAH